MSNNNTSLNTATCASCGQSGHRRSTYRHCPNNPNNNTPNRHDSLMDIDLPALTEASSSTPLTSAVCSACGQHGHRRSNYRHCPRNYLNNQIVVQDTPMEIDVPTTSALIIPVALCRCGSTTHSRITHTECDLNPNRPAGLARYNIARQVQDLPSRHTLGTMTNRCIHCEALMYAEEKTKGLIASPEFQLCCGEGKYVLDPWSDTPAYIKFLLQNNNIESNDFKRNVRSYNNALSFTSMGVNMDTSLQNGPGTYCYRIHGAVHHRIGSLLPEPGNAPIFAQVYIYDRSEDVQLNSRHRIASYLNRQILAMLQNMMLELPNPYLSIFITMKEYINQNPRSVTDVRFVLRAQGTPDPRRYNMPVLGDEIAVLIVNNSISDSEAGFTTRDIVLRPRNGEQLRRISETHQSYDPLGYPLLFPRGEEGWQINSLSRSDIKVSTMEFYAFRLMYRNDNHSLHLYGKLFHQYIVDMYAKMEQTRLNYLRHNQSSLRAELYQGLQDALATNDRDLRTIGRRIILPSSFIGSPRHMGQLYQDAISIVRKFGKPDLFITFTCNPKWPEIQGSLLYNQTAAERPDLCSRVFRLKLNCMMNDILKNDILGKVLAHIRVIEFQKRGLPHAHILLILHPDDKPRTQADIDSIISAEIPNPLRFPKAHDTVTKNMIHGPCGDLNPNAVCMENDRCNKKYPRPFTPETSVSESGYPIYRRREDGRIVERRNRTIQLDNKWVVPHNIYLCTKYDAHINVEVCNTLSAVKYLYKYVYKGHDCASAVFQSQTTSSNAVANPEVIAENDEIKKYLDARYVSAPEATWRIFSFSLHKEYPAHQRLAIHLPNEEMVYFHDDETPSTILNRGENTADTLTQWFVTNQTDHEARNFLYSEFPENYVWKQREREWARRQRGFGGTIGRIYSVSPREGEKYFLRLLLLNKRGATGYEDLRTVEGVLHINFQAACRALGLLRDDQQWINCLEEACSYQLPYELRSLFVIILIFCIPSHPFSLWVRFRRKISEDYIHRKKAELGGPAVDLTEEQLEGCYDNALLDINESLAVHNKIITEFDGFTLPENDNRRSAEDEFAGEPQIIVEQLILCREAAEEDDPSLLPFNSNQRVAFDTILDAALVGPRGVFFVDGPGGTGKTFLFNAILNGVRREGHICLAVASSGTASLLLKGGKTAHSTFKIPIALNTESTCAISLGTDVAQLIQRTELIIWDEASMISADAFNAVERTFRDLMGAIDPDYERQFFGGKLVVFGGDFRQVLPVVPRGSRRDVIEQCINQQTSWRHVRRLRLTENMRVIQALENNNQSLAETLSNFTRDLLAIGNGTYTTVNTSDYIRIPDQMLLGNISLPELSLRIYNNFQTAQDVSIEALSSKAILAATNRDVQTINDSLLHLFPETSIEYRSVDTCTNDGAAIEYPVEFLNSINHSSLPPNRLNLKVGCTIMVLRNIDPSRGLCNGTRLICNVLRQYNIQATIITGPRTGSVVSIPRIELKSDPQQVGVEFTRLQFPIRLAFAMTINKSQGQTLEKVGVYLPQPVFGHGQLYVAMSRAKRPEDVTIAVNRDTATITGYPGQYTANVVYHEVLLNVRNPF